jgi:hypothetical protein
MLYYFSSLPVLDNLHQMVSGMINGVVDPLLAITHPNIAGPFNTGWGFTDFEGEGFLNKVGLPSLPGQVTMLQR